VPKSSGICRMESQESWGTVSLNPEIQESWWCSSGQRVAGSRPSEPMSLVKDHQAGKSDSYFPGGGQPFVLSRLSVPDEATHTGDGHSLLKPSHGSRFA
jgi:hypothetical protein